MNEEEKETYMRYCKYDKEPKEVIMNLVSVIEKQQAEIEDLKKSVDYTYEAYQDAGKKMFEYSEELEQLRKDFEIVDHECSRLEQEDIRKDKIINEMKKENHDLKEKLQMFIPRRRVRRVYKMLGKILSVDIDPIILEKELKAEYKIKEDK